ncbi:hypothetical protein LTR36_000858 [Oleoguttula mirabilis]|uniref:O-methyltransferase C-terminal domain-containing protein n=1 Tax=Oleoguttula mirabilis TaxID=1507867 RepID=A0AAV9J309_9PEZI|nr:hypothetical protein LTR36_000858 [Oleoguttula mirabilis]
MATHATLLETAKAISALTQDFNGDMPSRMALLSQIDKLRFLVEGPMGPILRQFGTLNMTAALSILTSSGVLQAVPRSGTISARQLAETTDVDESAITRSMRIICIQGIAEEPTPDTYAHNEKSLAHIEGYNRHIFGMTLDFMTPCQKLPEYFRTHGTKELHDVKTSPYAYGHGREGATFYEVISEKPERFEAFNGTLVQMDSEMPVLGMFPFDSMKTQVQAETHRPFIVDVGGGVGRILTSIQQEAPAGFGAPMILQDRPDVLASIKDEDIPNITKMEHDFFQPQPVKGAHIYHLRRILHDFYDDVCVQIVRNIASAMAPDSRLLIGDFVIPEKTHVGDDSMVYWMDFTMMMIGGRERRAEQFRAILEGAGLEMVKIWPSRHGPQAIVEARLKTT